MIELAGVELRQGSFALSHLSFSIPSGQYCVLMGRTGSGKTTILEGLCGLIPLARGKIILNGADVTDVKPGARGIGYVPQDGALFSTMTVREHLAFSLKIRKWDEPRITTRVAELAELLGLATLLDRKPFGLSGGEAQRVALGRALASQPPVLCLDEPLSALDDETREEMYVLLKAVQRHTGVTTLHVTHHQVEAERLGDMILVLREGRIQVKKSS
jgi:molybdate/tungstate transport system ATP-binding protein